VSLAAEFAKVTKRPVGTPCTFVGIRAALSDADNAALTAALADDTISTASIAEILRARGFKLSGSTVQRHKRRDCACVAR
jgi:hypothetical protein